MGQAGRVSGFDVTAARLERLRHELHDEGIRVSTDGVLGELLVAELDYARHPPTHAGVAPRYGALVATDAADTVLVGPASVLDDGDVSLAVVRRLADGRSSFVARAVGIPDRLLCFDRTREYESSAVHLAL